MTGEWTILTIEKNMLIYDLNIVEDGTFIQICMTGGILTLMSVNENE